MKERPILFSGPMVRAILEGRKTQTRRIVDPGKLQQYGWLNDDMPGFRCPYGIPGDRLWVRETWWPGVRGATLYRATDAEMLRWKPSIHMPRARSRITLEVTGVRVERVQDISEADARAEGAALAGDDELQDGAPDAGRAHSHRAGFAQLWDSINEARGYGWQINPFCWAIEFKRVQS